MPSREELLAAIAREESRLAGLQEEIDAAKVRLAELRTQLHGAPAASLAAQSTTTPEVAGPPATNPAKLDLFRSLFHGREDVFARRWENAKTGKAGYSPACHNEWDWRLCEKKNSSAGRRATCGECSNQSFIPFTAEEIARHLRGEQVIGVYPLLSDETCWFLAADFDKRSWQEDVAAFVETCETHGVPVAVERSRSGNGAHAWILFSTPVPAAAARKLGCFLITGTDDSPASALHGVV